jgi:hypothetical protein
VVNPPLRSRTGDQIGRRWSGYHRAGHVISRRWYVYQSDGRSIAVARSVHYRPFPQNLQPTLP